MAEIEAIADADINRSDLPEMDAAFFETARLVLKPSAAKQAVSLRLDEDVIAWFRAQGPGHLSRMNQVLRAYMLARKAGD